MIIWQSKAERFLRADGTWADHCRQLRLEKWQLILTDHYTGSDGHQYDGCHWATGIWKRFEFGHFSAYYDGNWDVWNLGPIYVERYS